MRREVADLTELVDALREVGASAAHIGTLLLWPWGLSTTDSGSPRDELQQQRVLSVVWRLDRAFATVTNDPRALEEGLRDLLAAAVELQPQVLAWIDFLETLCHEVERAYGAAAGRGEFKRLQVKAALLYYVRRAKLDIPQVPTYLEPIILELWGGSIADQIVMFADRFNLWAGSGPLQPPARRRVQVVVTGRFFGIFQAVSDWFTNLAWALALQQNPLRPAIRQTIDRLDPRFDSLPAIPTLMTWAVKHRAQLAALVEVAGIATGEAEGFVKLSGAEKKAYARDLIFALLERSGMPPVGSGLLRLVTDGLVDVIIDAVVSLFNKHGHFQHRAAALQSAVV